MVFKGFVESFDFGFLSVLRVSQFLFSKDLLRLPVCVSRGQRRELALWGFYF